MSGAAVVNIMMTGATGYLGRRLIHQLNGANHHIAALKRATSTLPEQAGQWRNVHWHDIECESIADIVDRYQRIDVIVHLATDYGRGDEASLAPFRVNLALPMSLIDAVLKRGEVTVINTDSFFTALNDYDYLRAYILSKRQFLEWGRLLAEAQRLRFVNCRVFHMYGPDDSEEKFVNRLVRQCREHASPIALTSGAQQRDFVYVDDVVSALMTVLNRLDGYRPGCIHHDVGTGQAMSVKTLVETIHRLTRSRSVLQFGALPTRAGEPERMVADPASLRALGWAPAVDLVRGIQAIIG